MTDKSTIKTLDEILADMGKPVSAKVCEVDVSTKHHSPKNPSSTNSPITSQSQKSKNSPKTDRLLPDLPKKQPSQKPSSRKSHTQNPDKPSAVSLLLNDKNQTVLDDDLLRLLSKVEIEKLQIPDRQTRYMRWLAFYYLSKKELSRHELKTKLLAKDCDPMAVDELLTEFAKKGYQSDERCATMMVREAVRKGRGVRYISEHLKKAGLDIKDFGGMDELIAMSDVESVADGTILDNDDKDDEIDWLKLAVEARCKKYGDTIPKDPKEKGRQLRFLQYRGFEMDVCFEALRMTLDDFE